MTDAITWWRANRERSPDLLEDEIADALFSLRSLPNRGVGVPRSAEPARRRLLTASTNYVITYRVRPRLMRVEVLSLTTRQLIASTNYVITYRVRPRLLQVEVLSVRHAQRESLGSKMPSANSSVRKCPGQFPWATTGRRRTSMLAKKALGNFRGLLRATPD